MSRPESAADSLKRGVAAIWTGVWLNLRGALAISLALAASPHSSVHPLYAQGKHAVTLDDLLSVKDLDYSQELSPDGRFLAYTADGIIWVVATRPGGAPNRLSAGYLPRWSPDGERLAYYSEATGAVQLWVRELETNHAEPVTNVIGGIDPDPRTIDLNSIWTPLRYAWSPDGNSLVFASQVMLTPTIATDSLSGARAGQASGGGAPLVLTPRTPPELTLSGIFTKAFPTGPKWGWAFWEGRKRLLPAGDGSPSTANHLFVVNVHTKMISQLTKDDAGYFNPEWSPDGKHIACASSDGRHLGSLGVPTNIYVIDAATGEKAAITTGLGTNSMPSWSLDGRYIAFSHVDDGGGRRVFVASSAGGHSADVTAHVDRSVLEFGWLPDSKAIVAMYVDGVSRRIARVSLASGHVEALDGDVSASRERLTVSRSGGIAWEQSDPTAPAVIRFRRPGEDSSYVLVDLNPQVRAWALGEQEVVRWKNHRGDDLEGVLIKPIGYLQGHRYPLIVDAYPIQSNGFKGWAMAGNQGWAARGYAVFMPTARAPHFWMGFIKSEAYTQAAKGPKGWDITEDDVMSGVDELIRRGIADPDRMGLYGFSNGGGIVNYLVTRTHRFRCAVSVAGARSDWVRPSLLHTESGVARFEGGTSLWADPEAYIQLSAVFHLDKVTTPMLLADGDEDGDFLLDTIEMYNGLRQFGQDVTLLRYPDQGHGFTGPALKDFWQWENAFFDHYLKPVRPPARS